MGVEMTRDPWFSGALFTFGIFCLLCVLTYANNMFQCSARWEDSKFGFLTGCMVNSNGEYIPERNVHVIKWVYE